MKTHELLILKGKSKTGSQPWLSNTLTWGTLKNPNPGVAPSCNG